MSTCTDRAQDHDPVRGAWGATRERARSGGWVRLLDSYPEDCETWVLLADDEDEVGDAMEEVQ